MTRHSLEVWRNDDGTIGASRPLTPAEYAAWDASLREFSYIMLPDDAEPPVRPFPPSIDDE